MHTDTPTTKKRTYSIEQFFTTISAIKNTIIGFC